MSGSLLGVELKDIRSLPVGFLSIKEMFPLDLEEFANAVGVQPEVLKSIHSAFANKTEVDALVHEKMMAIFRLYMVIGGMPAAVAEYLESNNIQNVVEIQQSIIELYKKDIAKYDPKNKLYLNEIFDLIPPELNNQNKRFILKKLNENLKFSHYENSFIWLKEAGVAIPVYNVDEPQIPLLLSRSRNLFKLFLNDVGLLTCQYANGIQLKILNGDPDINFGSVYENVAATEFRAHGFDLYYFNSKKQGELDFVIEQNGNVLPIEIKSGKDYKRHNALKNVMETPNYAIRQAVVFCNDNVRTKDNILYCPIYMFMFLNNEKIVLGTYKLDLSGLGVGGATYP
jgi:predicted AAA+ superfamily ATPase